MPTKCLSVFDHFMGLALKGLVYDIILSCIILENGQTYFKNLVVRTPQEFWSMFDHFQQKFQMKIDLSWFCYLLNHCHICLLLSLLCEVSHVRKIKTKFSLTKQKLVNDKKAKSIFKTYIIYFDFKIIIELQPEFQIHFAVFW